MIQKFSKIEAIKFGWELAKKNIKFFALVLIFVWGIPISLGIFANLIKKEFFLASLFPRMIEWVISIIFSLGLIKISLRFCDKERPRFSEIFSQYPLFFRYFFTSILYNLIVFLGIILLLIPGIIFGIRLSFYDYFIVDKNSRIIESLKRSWQITEGNTLNLFLFYLLLGLINVLGILALIFGLFWTIPTTILAEAFAYRKLLSFSKIKG